MRSSLAILKTIVTLTPTETPMDVPGSRTEVSGRRVKFPRILGNRTAAWFEMNIGCECSGQQPETQCCTFCSAAGWQANDSAHTSCQPAASLLSHTSGGTGHAEAQVTITKVKSGGRFNRSSQTDCPWELLLQTYTDDPRTHR